VTSSDLCVCTSNSLFNASYIRCNFSFCGIHTVVLNLAEMILLYNLKGAIRLERCKDIFVHVSACFNYDFNALTLDVWKL
jgi:hypothetical protein